MSEHQQKKDDHNQPLVISYLALRRAVGILGIALPVALTIGVFILDKCSYIQDSISDYYYTTMGNLLVGILCAIGLFLFSYKGYERKDKIASKLACLFAIGIAFCPTYGPDPSSICNILHRNSSSLVSTMHDIFATLFFLTLAYFSLFQFTKTSGHMTKQKKKRNKVYKACGYIILTCIVLLFIYFRVPGLRSALKDYKPIFLLETIALWAFGFSWLTKGEFILKD
jgi:succinate dehydrogenase/fumarate reductase cytochrome b subunit